MQVLGSWTFANIKFWICKLNYLHQKLIWRVTFIQLGSETYCVTHVFNQTKQLKSDFYISNTLNELLTNKRDQDLFTEILWSIIVISLYVWEKSKVLTNNAQIERGLICQANYLPWIVQLVLLSTFLLHALYTTMAPRKIQIRKVFEGHHTDRGRQIYV